jgi:hypothetical protein
VTGGKIGIQCAGRLQYAVIEESIDGLGRNATPVEVPVRTLRSGQVE